ncbi:MAG: hypothetical protein IT429_00845 [Gemmataceae bacterium]|nr:hypothetical protein [Gemmataceae bacterium]
MRSSPSIPAGPEATAVAWRPNLLALVVISALLTGMLLGAGTVLVAGRGHLAPYRYSLFRWEADHAVEIALAQLGLARETSAAGGEAAIRRYFALTSQVRAASSQAQPDLALVQALDNERALYENDVERAVERYIGEAVGAAGLDRHLPLFPGARLTWPMVNFELTTPPRLLVRSPRSTIRRDGDTLLKSGLTLRDIERIESREDSADQVSIVVAIGGLAAYPAIVRDDRSYESLLDTASHEWVHHYLAFYPLGEQWGNGDDAETLNETTANIAGREIANVIRAAHPLELPAGEDGAGPGGAAPTVDFNKEMHQLRLEVDALLAEGKVEEAERTMEERRQYLAENGVVIRKINQAYFAFYGTYADGPASSDPVGPKIERVWEVTKDVGVFLRIMREVEGVPDLDRAIALLEAASAGR